MKQNQDPSEGHLTDEMLRYFDVELITAHIEGRASDEDAKIMDNLYWESDDFAAFFDSVLTGEPSEEEIKRQCEASAKAVWSAFLEGKGDQDRVFCVVIEDLATSTPEGGTHWLTKLLQEVKQSLSPADFGLALNPITSRGDTELLAGNADAEPYQVSDDVELVRDRLQNGEVVRVKSRVGRFYLALRGTAGADFLGHQIAALARVKGSAGDIEEPVEVALPEEWKKVGVTLFVPRQ